MDLVRPLQRLFTGKLRLITLVLLFGFVFIYLVRSFTHSLYINRITLVDVNSVDYLENVHSSKDVLNYAVIIDAGSSGSRCHIYVWPPHTGDRRKLLQIRMLKDRFGKDIYKRIAPGLSSNAKHPERSFDYIYPLLTFAMEHIPSAKLPETPLYILATAGMRLLSADTQDRILQNLHTNIAGNTTFNFHANNVQVITGKEEGIYSWISINYLLEKFDHSLDSNQLTAINLNGLITTRPRTVGMLEIGGASMQIAFEVTNKYELEEIKLGFDQSKSLSDKKRPNYLAEFNLGCDSHATDHNYLLYVSTYLGLGANMGKRSYVHHLFHDFLDLHHPHIDHEQAHAASSLAGTGDWNVQTAPNLIKPANFSSIVRSPREVEPIASLNHSINNPSPGPVIVAPTLPSSSAAASASAILASFPAQSKHADFLRNRSINIFANEAKNLFFPVPNIELVDPCLPLNARSKENITDHNGNKYHVTLVGSGDFGDCEAKVNRLLDPSNERHLNCSNEANCPLTVLNRLRVPFTNSEFFGFSEFWYSMEDILRIGGLYNYFSFKKAASEYCATDWRTLDERHRKGLSPLADKNRMLNECFKSAWITSVLHTGFRMPKTFNHFRSALKIRQNEVQWTLGALLYRTRFFPLRDIQQKHEAHHSHANFIKSDPNAYWLTQILFIASMLTVVTCIVIYLRHLNDLVNGGGGLGGANVAKMSAVISSNSYRNILNGDSLMEVKIVTEPLIRSEI